MTSVYRYVLEQSAFEYFVRLDEREARHCLNHFCRLAANPHETGDAHCLDAAGRALQMELAGPHTVIFWADHAAGEVRIVDISPG